MFSQLVHIILFLPFHHASQSFSKKLYITSMLENELIPNTKKYL